MVGSTFGHYRIVEKIGAGGMGEVYRAHDDRLDRDVALKVLPSGTLANDTERKQFRKEALALARLNHPNIETIHEFDTQDGLDFLAMELIPGDSLKNKLKGDQIPEREIVRLGMQFADGLAAAHEKHIVHRDLKPANLMITPDGRLKILDFGLARLLQPQQDLDVTLSLSSATTTVSGTVPYMSPEQLKGLPVDARSDIYAAGAVLYEMATGQRPFPQAQNVELMGAILHQTPAPPRSLNQRITPALESVILKALEKEPAQRYQSARELHVALEGVSSASATLRHAVGRAHPLLPLPRGKFAALAISALAIILLVGIALGLNIGGWRNRLFRRSSAGTGAPAVIPAQVRARRSVAVLGFKNISARPEDAWLSTAFSEMLTTELAAGEQLRTVAEENVARMKMNLSLPDDQSYSRDTLARIRKNISADDVVVGSYVPLGEGQVRFDVQLQDTKAGEILLAVSEKGSETHLDDLVSRAGAELRDRLGAGEVSAPEAAAVRETFPQNPSAARDYSEGLRKLRLSDYQGARDSLEKVVAADPKYALGHSALAVAWKGLGYDAKASDEARLAYDLSANLSREERLWIEGQYHELTSAWPQAVANYRALFDFFPDNLDYGLRLAAAQTSAGKGKDALATLDGLRKLPAPMSQDPRIDLAEAVAASSQADFKQEYAASSTAVTKADAQGARLLAAEARISQCSALRYLGKPKDALSVCQQAKDIFNSAGERIGSARALNNIAVVLMEEGDWPGAKKAYEEALATDRAVGDRRAQAMVLNNLAGVLHSQMDLDGSIKMLEEALANFREIGENLGVVHSLENLGIVLGEEGNFDQARKRYQESLAISRRIGNKRLTAFALQLMGDVYFAQGNLAAAQKNYLDSLSIRKEVGEPRTIAESQLALASLAAEQGRFSQAESSAREALSGFQNVHDSDNQAFAYAILARSLRSQDKLADAHAALDQASALVKSGGNAEVRLSVQIEAARLLAASGKPSDLAIAEKSLLSASSDAAKQGLTALQFESLLALGETEMKMRDPSAGRARLLQLEKDARTKGFLLLALRARAASR